MNRNTWIIIIVAVIVIGVVVWFNTRPKPAPKAASITIEHLMPAVPGPDNGLVLLG